MALANDINSRQHQSFIEVGSATVQRVGVFNSSGTQVDSFAGGTQYAVDTASGATDTGTLALAIRDDALTSLTPVDGDYVGLRVGSTGALHTVDVNSAAILADTANIDTNIGTIAGAVYVDDADWTAATSSHALVGGVYVSGGRTATDGDTVPLAVDVNGHLITNDHAETVALVDNVSNTANIRVDEAGAFAAQATFPYYYDGSTWDRTRGDATNGLLVNLGTNNDVVTTNAGTFAVQEDGAALTALQLIDDPIATVSATPLMRVAVFDASDSQITSFGGGTQYTEDDAAPANPVGTAMMMERDDVLGGLTPIAGDWTHPFATAEGALWTQDFNSDAILADTTAILADTANMDTNLGTIAGAVTGTEMQVDIVSGNVTNAGTFAVQVDGSALTALQLIDNIVHVDDAAFTLGTDSGVMMMGFAGTQSVNANDAAALACDTDGALHIADGGNSITVDNAGTFAVQVDAALPAGTNAIGKLAANSGVDIGDVDVLSLPGVAGDVAHDTADSGNPVKVGGKAKNQDATAPGTAVAEDDRTDFITDVYGRQFVSTHHPNLWDAADNQATAQTNKAIKAAPGAGLSLYITDVIVSNGATAGNIKFVEDTAGTPVDLIEVMYLAANGGAPLHFNTPIKVTANKDFGYTSTTVTTHSVTVCGYIAP